MNTKHLYTSLGSGVTQGSVTDNTIIDSSVIEVYFDNTDCYIDGTSQEGHTVYFNVGGNATGTNVCVVVNNLTDFVPYDDSALVSRVNTAEVNLGLLDDKIDERVPDETLLGGVLYQGTTGNTWKKLNANNLNYDDESTIYSAMGDIDSLETTSKNLVGAINEVKESGGGSSQEVYDDTERVIGTWFGKPLYEKVITYNNHIYNNTDINLGVNNTDFVMIKKAICKNQADNVYQLPYIHPSTYGYSISILVRPKTTTPRTILVRPGSNYNTNEYIYDLQIIVNYTKVGD